VTRTRITKVALKKAVSTQAISHREY
jgi:hypothetical protein